MAFTFTVETGLQVAGANSYVGLAEASDYYAIDPHFLDTWNGLAPSEQEALLAWSTRILDQKTRWSGKRYTTTQSLRWPRYGARDADNNLVEPDVIPWQLRHATLELAKWLIENDPTTGADTEALKLVKVDVIEIEWQDGAIQSEYPSLINQLLYPLGHFNTGGPTFGRIVRG